MGPIERRSSRGDSVEITLSLIVGAIAFVAQAGALWVVGRGIGGIHGNVLLVLVCCAGAVAVSLVVFTMVIFSRGRVPKH
jgi:hypothetical protein